MRHRSRTRRTCSTDNKNKQTNTELCELSEEELDSVTRDFRQARFHPRSSAHLFFVCDIPSDTFQRVSKILQIWLEAEHFDSSAQMNVIPDDC
jgi:hypothetical protein